MPIHSQRVRRSLVAWFFLTGALAVMLVSMPATAAGGGKGNDSKKVGKLIAQAAKARIKKPGRLLRKDCSGFVMTVLRDVGIAQSGNTKTFWAAAKKAGRLRKAGPQLGDFAYFDRTYDANGNGRVDDSLSHLAIVTQIDEDGTVHLAHHASGRVGKLVLNLSDPDLAQRDGKRLNSYLRARNYGPKNGPRLSGQLLRGFSAPPPANARPRSGQATNAKAEHRPAKVKSKSPRRQKHRPHAKQRKATQKKKMKTKKKKLKNARRPHAHTTHP